MYKYFGVHLVSNLVESFVDNVFFEKVKPEIGSVVYCELLLNTASHTGIYVGDDLIVHLNGDGIIELVTPDEFMGRLNGRNTAMSIYVSCNDTEAVGDTEVAERAKAFLNESREYHIALNNCHGFTIDCILGVGKNGHTLNFLSMLNPVARLVIGSNTLRGVQLASRYLIGSNNWRVWDIRTP